MGILLPVIAELDNRVISGQATTSFCFDDRQEREYQSLKKGDAEKRGTVTRKTWS